MFLGPNLPRALYVPRMANLPENRLFLAGGSSGDLRDEVGGGDGSSKTNFLNLFLKVYELSLPNADSWIPVSKDQNTTCYAMFKTWRKISLQQQMCENLNVSLTDLQVGEMEEGRQLHAVLGLDLAALC